ncbi:hypothetical protein ACFVUY_42615, partial [Kitasatospora sp. NPDC058063]|uniref:hypothetical protein n=1 Tax=Kitasatospora sp. NPDC058063 TaxID=3346321 RepID=UPI0036D91732
MKVGFGAFELLGAGVTGSGAPVVAGCGVREAAAGWAAGLAAGASGAGSAAPGAGAGAGAGAAVGAAGGGAAA